LFGWDMKLSCTFHPLYVPGYLTFLVAPFFSRTTLFQIIIVSYQEVLISDIFTLLIQNGEKLGYETEALAVYDAMRSALYPLLCTGYF
jgi:hypothetical protein